MSNILALDTSSDNCSVALWDNESILQLCEKAPRSHTQLALPMVQDCLSKRGIKAKDLNAIAFGCGPGSFTGIRIAAGIAQGLAYGSDCSIYAISNIQALALQSYLEHQNPLVLVAIDARMDEVYWALCRVNPITADQGKTLYQVDTLGEELVTSPEKVSIPDTISDETIIGAGSGFDFSERFSSTVMKRLSRVDSSIRPEARAICELARYSVHKGLAGKIEDAMPSYVRNTVTWKKLPGRE